MTGFIGILSLDTSFRRIEGDAGNPASYDLPARVRVVDGADAFFPAFAADQWRIRARVAHAADTAHAFAFDFVDYARI